VITGALGLKTLDEVADGLRCGHGALRDGMK
jgi:hypothetical protein